ncbi:hypothetical protein SUNI508_06516 [Seiridium unicorne]|uniref:Rhodopsin domain-containing protein n=1 Tax=Seiridium unicorne TaxID=138068 RepID=A0ABR2UZX2_9PEZI
MDVPDRGPEVLAVSWTLPVLSLIFLVLRLYCKFMRHRGLWWDDHVLTASWIACLVCSIILTVNVRAGFGKHQMDIATENLAPIGMRGVIVGIFMVIATGWSKTSFALTLLRLVNGWQKTALWVIIVTVNIFLTLSGFTNLLQCSPVDKVWQPYLPGTCWPSNVNLGISIFAAAYSALMDLALALAPWFLILKLQMKRREKFGVAVAMSMGVFAAVTGIIKCVKLQALASANFFYDGGDLSIWSMAEIHTTIMAASIPVLRALGREITSSASRYYAQSHDRTRRYTRTGDNTVTITSSKRPPTNYQSHDGASDKSILHGGIGKIMQVNEIQIKYGDKSDNEGAYELDKLDRHRSPI